MRLQMKPEQSTFPVQVRWVTSAELYRAFKISHTTVRLMRRVGVFIPGEHFLAKGLGSRPPLLWDLQAVEKVLRDNTRALPETYFDGDS